MKKHSLYILPIIAIVCTAILCSCGQKEIVCLDDSDIKLTVAFDWDNAPDAQVDGMTLYFFPQSAAGQIWRFDISGSEGGTVELPFGCYKMIAVNNDLPGVSYSGAESFDTFTANARDTGIDTMLMPTGVIFSTTVDNIVFDQCGVTYTKDTDGCDKGCPKGLIRCHPDTANTIYNIIIGRIDGDKDIKSATATICGVATSLNLSSGTPGDRTAAIKCVLSQNKTWPLYGSTTGFFPGSASAPCTLVLTMTTSDGTTYSKSIDITGQILNSNNTHLVNIYIDEVKLPDYTPDDSDKEDVGMDNVIVDGWTIIEIDL